MSKNRSFVFTLNNYSSENVQQLRDIFTDKASYAVFGFEVSPSTRTPHLQGYVRWKSPLTFSSVKTKLLSSHIEVAQGTPQQNYDYASKDGNYEEFGTMPHQGKRKLADVTLELIENKTPIKDIIKEEPRLVFRVKELERVQSLYLEQRTTKPTVIWCYGPTGTGKTKFAFEYSQDTYWKPTGKWFDGYTQQQCFIWDDFRAIDYPYNDLLKLLDRYPLRVEYKGGSVQFNSATIIITCPHHPRSVYVNEEDPEQLLRRIDEIKEFAE